ncbi:histidine phosphatase family protein [Vitiosangium sp. GDMCC 1.1324]|uniref:histidine phosphatase family protein n=1 Tax=Vitiosangium sp. (strain GDMCC 1.1324) TaxID=2138576 RepID=UPI000D33EADC|nr:histidine phosphatase family protein [Vitiosangium sp. GDMCC 1.1324]PTL82021.1 histidine phosphatase family protein [Vitiosangium sp. GDMCC 1.1324]
MSVSRPVVSAITHLVVIRHGETAWNLDRRLQGHLDVPLNAHGRAQAEALGRALSSEPLDAIYSSDLSRAMQTAQALATGRVLQVQAEPRLRERHFGIFQGLTPAEVEARHPEAFAAWKARMVDWAPAGGESLAELHMRILDITLTLARRHPSGRIALVAHGGVLDCLYRAASGMALDAPRQHELRNASINRLSSDGEQLTLVQWGDVTHLDVQVLDEVDRKQEAPDGDGRETRIRRGSAGQR